MNADAERQKLAHTLGVGRDRVAMVAALPAEDVRALRKLAGEALFRAGRPAFARVAVLSKTVPTAVSAKLSEAVLPPLIAARTAELLDPAKAADLVGRLPDGYLADVSAAMDPTRCPDVVAAIPAERVARIGRELARRKEWVVIGGFVSAVGRAGLTASLPVFSGEALLRIGYVLEDLSRLDEINDLVSDAQLDELFAAAAEHELWNELGLLLENLSAPRARRMAVRLTAAPEAVRAAIEAASESGALTAPAAEALRS